MPHAYHPPRAALSTALCGAVVGLAALAPAVGAAPPPAGGPPALAKLVRAAQADADENPCGTMASLERYRKLLEHLRHPKPPEPRWDPRAVERLNVDILSAQAALLGSGRTLQCGGAAVAAGGPATTVLESNAQRLRLRLSFATPRIDPRGVTIPARHELFAVPRGAALSVHADTAASYVLAGARPAPPAPESKDGRTRPRPAARGTLPVALVRATDVGRMRDLRVGALDVAAGRLDRTHRLRVYTSLTVTITFKDGGDFGTDDINSVWNLPFLPIYKSLRNATAALTALAPAPRKALCGEEMLIITASSLRPAADALAAARATAGIRTTVLNTGTGPGRAGTTADDIRATIRRHLHSDCVMHPSYVVVVGDTDHLPTFHKDVSIQYPDIASDLQYSLDGDDLLADVQLGRIPAPDLATANRVIAKTVAYESSAPAPAGDDFYSHASVASWFDWSGFPKDHDDQSPYTVASEKIAGGLQASGGTVDRVYSADPEADPRADYDGKAFPPSLRKPAFGWNGSAAQLIAGWNAGRNVIVHRDHGAWDQWEHPYFGPEHVAKLSAGTQLPVVFAINCASAAFDDPSEPSLDERLLQRPGGAVAIFGASRDSPTLANNYLAVGFLDALYPAVDPGVGAATPVQTMGQVLISGKNYVAFLNGATSETTRAEHYLYNYFGDPSLALARQAPKRIDTGALTVAGRAAKVAVATTQTGLDGAIVTLRRDGEAVGRGVLRGGTAEIAPEDGSLAGALSIVLDQAGFLPTELPVPAAVPEPSASPAPTEVPTLTPTPTPTPALATALTQQCPLTGAAGQPMTIVGRLAPARAGARISVRYERPDGATVTHTVATAADGSWRDELQPARGEGGLWTVSLHYAGDEATQAADALPCRIRVAG